MDESYGCSCTAQEMVKWQAARIERLEAALTPFAFLDEDTTQEAWEIRYRDRFQDWIDFGDIELARAALQEPQS